MDLSEQLMLSLIKRKWVSLLMKHGKKIMKISWDLSSLTVKENNLSNLCRAISKLKEG